MKYLKNLMKMKLNVLFYFYYLDFQNILKSIINIGNDTLTINIGNDTFHIEDDYFLGYRILNVVGLY